MTALSADSSARSVFAVHADTTAKPGHVGTTSSKDAIHILVVDDDRAIREGCASFLQTDGYTVSTLARGDEALEAVKRRKFDIILLDLFMTQVPGMDILRAAVAARRDTIVVVMTGSPSVASSVDAMRLGAWDYLPKPFTATQLEILVGRAAHAVAAARETRAERAQALQGGASIGGCPLVGASATFRRVIDLAGRVATTDASVMISGESGTGKEGIAQLIHRHSYRSRKRLVAINCAALPEPLLESEMFGHRKGAFTGADRDKPGLLEMAHEGTLFLDELTEMSQLLQAKLLRVLQDGVVRRVGSEEPNATVHVRFISATNRDPTEAVRSGILREDLFFRLRVVHIKVPPLRERRDDIALLADHFLAHYWERHRGRRERAPTFAPETLEFLRQQPWRGNVRELQNVIEHVAVLANPGDELRPKDIPAGVDLPVGADARDLASDVMEHAYHTAKDTLVTEFEKAYLSRLVDRAGGNMSKAARLASIDRTTLYRLMEKHCLQRPPEAEMAD